MSKVGVVVGRFQVPALSQGHLQLLEHVFNNSDHVLIFLGVAPFNNPTRRNPLDYITRKLMIDTRLRSLQENFDVFYEIMPLKDLESDALWCQHLDSLIALHTKETDDITLYGGEDSFLTHYVGRHKKSFVDTVQCDRGIDTRLNIKNQIGVSEDFRAGAIYTAQHLYPHVSCVVDVACLHNDNILLARKRDETLWRFPGGFVDTTDKSLEHAAQRELSEETLIDVDTGDFQYVGSFMVDDWRVRRDSEHGILTSLFACKVNAVTNFAPGSDVEELRWVYLPSLKEDMLIRNHRALLRAYKEWIHEPHLL